MAGTQALDRAVDLVRLVVQAEFLPTHTDLVEATGLPRSTVSRVLGALERGGLLEREDGGYRGGRLFADYAMRFDRTAPLLRAGRVHLERVAEATGETIHLAIARGAEVVQIDEVDARFVIGPSSWVGVTVPSHCSALGKVLMAWGAVPPPVGRLEVHTPETVRTHAQLEDHLAEVRRRGFASTRGELEEGLDGIAVPVQGVGGLADGGGPGVVAALGVWGPSFRIGEQHAEIAKKLTEASSAISRDLLSLSGPQTRLGRRPRG